MWKCPRCNLEAPSASKLHRHLSSRFRRLRCGAYEGVIDCRCCCGKNCNTIASLRRHLRRFHLVKCSSSNSRLHSFTFIPRKRLPANAYFESESSSNEEDRSVVEVHSPREDEHMVPESLPSSYVPTFDAHAHNLCALEWTFDFRQFHLALEHNNRLRALSGFYHFCLESGCSVRNYRKLVRLQVIDPTLSVPKEIKNLRRYVETAFQELSGWPSMKLFRLPRNFNPLRMSPVAAYVDANDALRIWLSIPPILAAVRESMDRYLPENLIDEAEYDDLIRKRKIDIESGVHVYESVADGSEYLPTIRSCIPKFRDNYVKALEDNIEVIVCTLGCYEDSFRKQKDSLINQQLFCLTLLEASIGEASLSGLSSLIIMLADYPTIKKVGGNCFWKVFVDKLCDFERGVRMVVEGKECLIIGITMVLFGDTPALKTMCGLSPSISSVCYVRMPCRTCEVLVEDLSESISANFPLQYRRIETYHLFYRYNNYTTGLPIATWVEEMMKQYGMLRVSEFVRLEGLLSPSKSGTDTLHAVYLGTLKLHFIMVVSKLVTAEYGGALVPNSVWDDMSRDLQSYFTTNRISGCWKFSTLKQFKTRVKAGSMRELAKVSAYIFYKLKLVDLMCPTDFDNTPSKRKKRLKKQMRLFNFWLLHVSIAQQLDNYSFLPLDLLLLERDIKNLLQYFHDDFPESFVTINVHYYKHIVDQIRCTGPMTIAANHRRERLIRKTKPKYRNINSVSIEGSVYRVYLDELYLDIQDYLNGGAKYQREILPEALANFKCSEYGMVSINNGTDIECFLPEDYDAVVLMCDNTSEAIIKLNYQTLRQGDCIQMSDEHGLVIGILIGIVYYLEQAFIAYCNPQLCETGQYGGTHFTTTVVNTNPDKSVLYLGPVSRFVRLIGVLKFRESTKILVY